MLLVMALLSRSHPSWLRFVLFLAGIFAELYVASAFIVQRMDMRDRWFDLVSHGHSTCGGICIGLLLACGLFDVFSRRARYAARRP